MSNPRSGLQSTGTHPFLNRISACLDIIAVRRLLLFFAEESGIVTTINKLIYPFPATPSRFVWTLCLFACLLATASPVLAEAVRISGNRIFVPIIVEGVATEALLDSGAEMTFMDSAFSEKLGISVAGSEMAKGTGGEQEVRFAQGVSLATTATTLADRTVAVLDLTDISERLVGETVSVVLGRDLFDTGRLILDFQSATLRQADPYHEPTGVKLRLTEHAGIKQMPVTIEGVQTLADFDLGNGSEVLIGRDFAKSNGWLSPERLRGRRSGGGIGGAVERDLIELESLSIAGVTFNNVTAAIDSTASASSANIGVSVLKHFLLTVDFPENALWLDAVESQ